MNLTLRRVGPGLLGIAVPLLAGCLAEPTIPGQSPNTPSEAREGNGAGGAVEVVARLEPRLVLRTVGEGASAIDVSNGGWGSALAYDRERGEFVFLTDRGPNVDYLDGKKFPVPEFSPLLGRFRLEDGAAHLVGTTTRLKRADGSPLSGLPNPVGVGGTGEVPYDFEGDRLPYDPDGLDPEGLVIARDGSYWIADEYGPWIARLDGDGRVLERYGPFAGQGLPRVLARRRPNRGMEGLAIHPDGRVLIGAMQSPLDNPTRAVRSTSRITRVLRFDPRSGKTEQFAYMLDAPNMLNSEITAVSATRFLVIERDGDFLGSSAGKRIYIVELEGATDVSDPTDSPQGRTYGGRTLEQLAPEEMATYGIVPARKKLVVDLLDLGYPHDKPEGIALVDNFTLAVANDDDFGVNDAGGVLVAKTNPALGGVVDYNTLWLVRLPRPIQSY